MFHATIGKWGRNLAVRVPMEVAKTAGLVDGERVEIETCDGDILIRRPAAHALADAQQAAEEIVGDIGCHRLGDIEIRKLIEEGRRG